MSKSILTVLTVQVLSARGLIEAVMIAETISLGILALPSALSTLGLIPLVFTMAIELTKLTFLRGFFVIIGVDILTTYTGYTIGQFKCRYVQIHSMADAGELLFGALGRETLGMAQLVFLVFVMGSHILASSIMMNVLTEHSTCTIVFSAVGLIVSFFLTLPRRLESLSHISTISFISIIGAVFISMVSVSLPNENSKHVSLFSAPPSVHDACLAVANIIFAYAGHVAFFTLFSELKDLKDFPKSLALLQMSEMILYTITAIVMYSFVGPGIASPALNSSGALFKKISYGIAIPTVCSLHYCSGLSVNNSMGEDRDCRRCECSCSREVYLCPRFSRY